MKEWEWTWTKDGTEHLITVKEEGEGYFTVWADDDYVGIVSAKRGSFFTRTVFGTDELVSVFGSELRLTVGRRAEEGILEPRADLFENGCSLRDGSTLAERREKLRAAAGKRARMRWILSAVWVVLAAITFMTKHRGFFITYGSVMGVANALCALLLTKAARIKDLLPDAEPQ